jgi:CO/xanthine dehydrogenase Mo-binding subunit
MGQGSRTIYAQIAAEILGVPLSSVSVKQVDTDSMHDSGPTVASRSTTVGGMAVMKAASAVKESLLQMAGLMLKVEHSEVEIKNGFAFLKQNPEVRVPIADVATAAYWTGFPLMNLAFSRAPDAKYDHSTHQGDIYIAYNFGTHLMEVEVDTLTGKVDILRHIACHDVGKVINLMGCEGQVEGASLMGYGLAHLEELLYRDGRMVNSNFADYWIPSIKDMLPTQAFFVEDPNPTGPFGAKGIGEPPLAGAAAAFANALANATGIRFNRLPITPQKILEEMRKRKEIRE